MDRSHSHDASLSPSCSFQSPSRCELDFRIAAGVSHNMEQIDYSPLSPRLFPFSVIRRAPTFVPCHSLCPAPFFVQHGSDLSSSIGAAMVDCERDILESFVIKVEAIVLVRPRRRIAPVRIIVARRRAQAGWWTVCDVSSGDKSNLERCGWYQGGRLTPALC